MGVQSSLRRARDIMFWPGMNYKIKERIKKCDIFSTYQKKFVKLSIQYHYVPEKPWIKVWVDIFHYKNEEYLIIVDYYSNFTKK